MLTPSGPRFSASISSRSAASAEHGYGGRPGISGVRSPSPSISFSLPAVVESVASALIGVEVDRISRTGVPGSLRCVTRSDAPVWRSVACGRGGLGDGTAQ